MRICIVTPAHLATDPRTVKEAISLAAYGHDVQVVCGEFTQWGQSNDQKIARNFDVIHVPFGPLIARKRTYVRQTIIRWSARTAVRVISNRNAWLCALAHSPISTDLKYAVEKAVPADLYIAHYVAALPAAASAAQRYDAKYAFDAEDFHLGDLPDLPENAVENHIIRAIETRYLPGTAYITAASPGIAKAYASEYGIAEPAVVLNTFPLKEAPTEATLYGGKKPRPSIYWFSQTIGPNRGLECAVRALAHSLTKPHLYLRGNVSDRYRETLETLAVHENVLDRLHFLPPASPDEMVPIAAQYDIGLVAETGGTVNRRIALTNKQFTYILAGIPAIMSDIPAHQEFAKNAHDAVVLFENGNPVDLAQKLDGILTDDETLAKARRAAFSLGQTRFNWDYEKNALISAVEQIL